MVHNIKLNLTKRKEMLVNFLHNPNCLLRPITIDNNVVDRVTFYRTLGVFKQ